MTERDPDIVSLAARLRLRGLTYRTFSRPPMAPPAPMPETLAPAPTVQMPETLAPAPPAPMPVILASPPPPPMPVTLAPTQAVTTAAIPAPEVAIRFPLLVQALARPSEPASSVPPASAALPFLNLRHAVLGAGSDTGH